MSPAKRKIPIKRRVKTTRRKGFPKEPNGKTGDTYSFFDKYIWGKSQMAAEKARKKERKRIMKKTGIKK